MYNKVETNMNFVDREKQTGKIMTSSKNQWNSANRERPTHSMTVLRLQMENHISDTY